MKHLSIFVSHKLERSQSAQEKYVQFDIIVFFIVIPSVKNILKYLSRMARVSLRTGERLMFLPVRTVNDAFGLCRYSIKVPFVVWELTVNNNNNNNNDFFNSLPTTKDN